MDGVLGSREAGQTSPTERRDTTTRRLLLERPLTTGERVYGLGDRASRLDRRGELHGLWNRDSPNLMLGRNPTYKAIPVLVGNAPGGAWGLFVETGGRLVFDLRGDLLRILGPADARLHEVDGEDPATVLGRLSSLIGRAPMPPRWALGYHQGRWSYGDAEQVRRVVATFRARSIPLDVMHLDIGYMDRFRVFTWDPRRFPDPRRLIEELGVRVVTILDPSVRAERGYGVHDEMVANRYACLTREGRPWTGRVWMGRCIFPDFSDPEVRHWWGDHHATLVDAGVDGIWNDMNEPTAGFFGTMPEDARQRVGRHGDHHNLYGHHMAQATHEGLARLRPSRRPFILTRSAFAGTQRYAATWTGDNASTWRHLRLAVRMCLGLGLSGYPFCGADIGGFAGRCSPELYARWIQVGAFTPFFRTHYAGKMTPHAQEPWSFGPEVQAVAREAIRLRHRLMPYTYTAFWRHTQTGLPVMRALALGWPRDPMVADRDDEYLWGDDLLVAPVLERNLRRRAVYLPPADWYDAWTGDLVEGGRTIVADAPLERIPLYARAGCVIPLAGGQLRVFPGVGTSWLYEDDGETVDGEACVTRYVVRGTRVETSREGAFPSAFPLATQSRR